MKKYILILLLFIIPNICSAQFFAIGGQYSENSKGQFMTSLSIPTYYKVNKFNSYISSGLEYTSHGNAIISGLNIKPLSINTFFSESFFNNTKYTVLLGVDAGYLFNFGHGKNGIILSPNLYVDYYAFFIKAGYDFNVTGNQQQFFVRAGISFGMGVIKQFGGVKIW